MLSDPPSQKKYIKQAFQDFRRIYSLLKYLNYLQCCLLIHIDHFAHLIKDKTQTTASEHYTIKF